MIKKSVKIKNIENLPDIDYADLPADMKAVLGDKPYQITEKVKLSSDGKQLIARIPKEIQKEFNLKKGDRMVFNYKKPLPESGDEPELVIGFE